MASAVWLCRPAPRQMMATGAKGRSWETPRVDDEASGFRSTFCMTHPTAASPMPPATAVTTRGRRKFHTTVLDCRVPLPNRANIVSVIDSPDDPRLTATSIISSVAPASKMIIMTFERMYFYKSVLLHCCP